MSAFFYQSICVERWLLLTVINQSYQHYPMNNWAGRYYYKALFLFQQMMHFGYTLYLTCCDIGLEFTSSFILPAHRLLLGILLNFLYFKNL